MKQALEQIRKQEDEEARAARDTQRKEFATRREMFPGGPGGPPMGGFPGGPPPPPPGR